VGFGVYVSEAAWDRITVTAETVLMRDQLLVFGNKLGVAGWEHRALGGLKELSHEIRLTSDLL
jgi:hypothetical protein